MFCFLWNLGTFGREMKSWVTLRGVHMRILLPALVEEDIQYGRSGVSWMHWGKVTNSLIVGWLTTSSASQTFRSGSGSVGGTVVYKLQGWWYNCQHPLIPWASHWTLNSWTEPVHNIIIFYCYNYDQKSGIAYSWLVSFIWQSMDSQTGTFLKGRTDMLNTDPAASTFGGQLFDTYTIWYARLT